LSVCMSIVFFLLVYQCRLFLFLFFFLPSKKGNIPFKETVSFILAWTSLFITAVCFLLSTSQLCFVRRLWLFGLGCYKTHQELLNGHATLDLQSVHEPCKHHYTVSWLRGPIFCLLIVYYNRLFFMLIACSEFICHFVNSIFQDSLSELPGFIQGNRFMALLFWNWLKKISTWCFACKALTGLF
jgi:hypothetical protein